MLSWEEIRHTPEPLLRRRLVALERARARARADALEDMAMSAEVNWGQEIIGQVPKSNLPYKVVDRPFNRHIYRLRRLGAGLPLEELPDERVERLQAENKRLDALLMN